MYVWLLDEQTTRARAQALAATLAAAVGAEVEIPDETLVRAQFDTWLYAEPQHDDPDQLVLRQALGL